MPASMTGFGDAIVRHAGWAIAVEVRSVNNRHLKVSVRLPDALASLESTIEKRVRAVATRGMVNVAVRCESDASTETSRLIDAERLVRLVEEYDAIRAGGGGRLPELADGGRLLALPGVIATQAETRLDAETVGPAVLDAFETAAVAFEEFRRDEGAAMAAGLRTQAAVLAEQKEAVAAESPDIVGRFQDKLRERLRALLADTEAEVSEETVVREAAVFADKADVTEEVVRLGSHLEQLEAFLASDEAVGRKLDFLTQEINREVNTIGSKANHAGLARRVVAMKAAVEKIREILQNIE